MSDKKRSMNFNKLKQLVEFLSQNGVTKFKDGELELELVAKFPEQPTNNLYSPEYVQMAGEEQVREDLEFYSAD